MNNKIIAVDFDGTLCVNKWPDIGEPIQKAIDYIKQEKANGAKLILWTCRVEDKLNKAVDWCKQQGIEFDAVNENLPEIVKSFGGNCRKVFANEYIDDRNNPWFALSPLGNDSWAAQEVERAIESEKAACTKDTDDWEYGAECYKSALRAYESFYRDGHSGFSIQVAKSILNRLLDGRCLTPIEDTPDIWTDITLNGDGKPTFGDSLKHYQCKRMSSLFKAIAEDGTVTYSDVDRVYGVNLNNPDASFSNGFLTRLIDKLFPITMPYLPSSKKFKVTCDEFLVDPKNGDYDTVAYLDILTPSGKKIELNRYFKEENGQMVQIEKAEFEERKAKRVKEESSNGGT